MKAIPDTGPSGSLQQRIDQYAVRAGLSEQLPRQRVGCTACGHRCVISPGHRGICKVRFNLKGGLYVPWGYVASLHEDPIEKKPFFHALPGAMTLSFGMLGCDFHCSFCQNWLTSQVLRDPASEGTLHPITSHYLVAKAVARGAEVVVSTYNEPLITAEWAADIFGHAHRAGLHTAIVTNGHATPEVRETLGPVLDFCKIDLKAFNPKTYRTLGGRLEPVLDTIRDWHQAGIWLEVVTLLIPGLNDTTAEIEAIAAFLADVSVDLPWHVTAFRPEYRMADVPATPIETLTRAAAIGRRAGLRYVYAGNLPGRVGTWEHTRCPQCAAVVIQRNGFAVGDNRLNRGCCPDCGTAIPGRWEPRRDPGGSFDSHPPGGDGSCHPHPAE
jgi:pyruvate formate lyase activating enzyme